MQKLIILDSETGIADISHIPLEIEDIETYIDECLPYNVNTCQWMVALEINNKTI